MINKIFVILIFLQFVTPIVSAEFIDAAGKPQVWGGVLSYKNKNNIHIKDFIIYNAPYFGIYLKNCSNVVISNCTIYNSQSSGIIAINCRNVSIINCSIIRCCMNGDQEGITLNNVDDFKVIGCLVEFSYKEGIDAKSGSNNGIIKNNRIINCADFRPGIYIDAYEDDIVNISVINNVVFGSGQGISLGTEKGGTLGEIYICYNVVFTNHNAFSIHYYNTTGSHFKDKIYVYYNFFKSNYERSVHITESPNNFGKFVMWGNFRC